MSNLKHVGRMQNNKRKIVVAYRVVPDEPENCIVVTTENLAADEHDSLMKLIESPSGQESNELADVMARTRLPDGRNMLAAFHKTGKLIKVASSGVEMTPNRNSVIMLSELNALIAEQAGVTVGDLAIKGERQPETEAVAPAPVVAEVAAEPLSDEALAAKYRSDADRLFKEAKRLREEAENLAPTKKKPTVKEEASA